MPLTVKSVRQQVEQFLVANDLKFGRLDYYAGVFVNDKLVAGGGLEENIMKCFAVSPEARGFNLMGKLIHHLQSVGIARGYHNFFAFTKPKNEQLLVSLAFHVIARAKSAILLETNPYGVSDFCRHLSQYKKDGKSGCIVMNCNPMTIGHLFLIESAAKQVDTLHIFVVSEDKSDFSSVERFEMAKNGTAHIPNVIVHNAGKYIISFATFPMYFFKTMDEQINTYIELDLNIFNTFIAPILNISVRFAGTEQSDEVTLRYNQMMETVLPPKGIQFVVIDRLKQDSTPVSASRVRKKLSTFHLNEAYSLIPETSKPYVLNKCAKKIADLAVNALKEELKATPKPGLVDKKDSGSHYDMDFRIMTRSVNAISPFFYEFARKGLSGNIPVDADFVEAIKTIGVNAEVAMLDATQGVNTHRGAIFSMGLCIVAVSLLIASGKQLLPEDISETIADIADKFSKQEISHGVTACKQFEIKGALDNAQEGYRKVIKEVLPEYQQMMKSGIDCNTAKIRALLLIISVIDDTNIYYRCGAEVASKVKQKSFELYQNYDISKVDELNRTFIKNHISPGGSADMLAVIIFLYNIIKQNN